MTLWRTIAAGLAAGRPCVLVTIAKARGSSPREQGARMVVFADGSFSGSIGGGTLEFQAIRWAQQAIADNRHGLELRTVSLGPDLGQCCGGRVDLSLEVLERTQAQMAANLASLEAAGQPFSVRGEVTSGLPIDRKVIEFTDNVFDISAEGVLLETFGEVRRHLYLFGAGHVGKALVLALAPMPFKVIWVDSRPEVFPSAVPGNVEKHHIDLARTGFSDFLAEAPAGAFVLAMTHSHALDEEVMAAALSQQRFSYCGVIGSGTKRARFEKRLKSRGLTPTLVSGMVCPIGVTTIRSKHPAMIAAGVVVDLLERDEIVAAGHVEMGESGRTSHNGG